MWKNAFFLWLLFDLIIMINIFTIIIITYRHSEEIRQGFLWGISNCIYNPSLLILFLFVLFYYLLCFQFCNIYHYFTTKLSSKLQIFERFMFNIPIPFVCLYKSDDFLHLFSHFYLFLTRISPLEIKST